MEDISVNQLGKWAIDQHGTWNVDVDQFGPWQITQRPPLVHTATSTPTFVNPSLIEYCRGELDKEKNQYGVRVHFASGNTLWLPGDAGAKFLATIESACWISKDETTKRSLVDKYNEKRSS